MMTRLAAATTATAAAALTLVGCSPATESGPTSTVSVASPEPSVSAVALPPAPEDPTPEVAWPLTGVDASDATKKELNRPALSIKIENTEAARPQENLDKADVVFEEYVEYGISRFVAVFQSEYPESVGPIRSMRPMDKNIMGSFDGPLIFSGAQSRFISSTASSGQEIITQDRGDYGFYRTSTRSAPHNLHGYLAKFLEQTDADAPDAQWEIAYPASEATAQLEGEKASFIDITMSPRALPEWRWNKSDRVWERYEDGEAHVTSAGTQLTADNVVMLWVKVRYTSGSSTSSVPETLVAGESGEGYVASGNKYIPITWSKAGQFDPFVLTTLDGDEVELKAGKTWFELVPSSGVGNSTDIAIS
ncbi:DUF3048 domain-containing protein [Demequina mangrovi]|uniref:DUF3048 domain-containing protein n=1 Tax=Demequina mangrovi TaxID=1043493 RepID=A0A1H6W9D4_9MICO|nr:DUF3048 domain-containing protein [Demequina mangrovi]SEJ13598.1 Protein of unknown function [Demequina mangrovi]